MLSSWRQNIKERHDMDTQVKDIRPIYIEGLKEYIKKKNDSCLSEAYQKSRELLPEGLSELNLVELHHEALNEIFKNDSVLLNRENIKKASFYLKEWMAPLEVKLNSYRAVIDELNVKNEQLKEEIENRRRIQTELVNSKNYFQTLIENAQDIITVLDLKGIIRFDTPSVYRILGYNKHELVGSNVFRLIHEKDLENVVEVFNRIKKNPERIESSEFRIRHKKGQWVWLESIAKFVPDSRDGPVIVINSRNITNRKQRLRKLRESRAKLAEAQRIAKVGSWEWRPGGKPELEWSDEMCRIYGIRPENFDHSYETFINHMHPEDRERIEKKIKKALENKTSFSFEHKIVRSSGEVRELLGKGRVVVDENDHVIKILGTGQDITEQKEKEKRLREYSERLRRLSARVERTREEERIRIAREIHDELGQMLTVLKMDVSTMSGEIKKKVSGKVLEYFNNEAEKILDRINTIMKSVQRITTELRPEVLDDLGLVEALQWQAHEFEKRTNLKVHFSTELERSDFLNDDVATTLFRTFQETMNNIIRHAEASEVKISLERKNDNLLLSIFDNGKGITQEQKEASSSFGIIGMRERTRFLGGDVFIEGNEGKGTRVTLQVPLDEENVKL